MIIRSFYNKSSRHYAHFVACRLSGEAALVDPLEEDIEHYIEFAAASNAKIRFALQTRVRTHSSAATRRLQSEFDVESIMPSEPNVGLADRVVRAGDELQLGQWQIHVVANTPPAGNDVAYRIGDTLFTGYGLVRGDLPEPGLPVGRNELIDRVSKDIDALFEGGQLTSKEKRLALSYQRLLTDLGRPPSAQELADDEGAELDRGGVHVIVHGLRRKQLAHGQIPMMIHGQMKKWLRGLQGEPDFTHFEREFLAVYLAFVQAHGRIPTGGEMLDQLPGRASIQWVRKRVHTIRRKQIAFNKAPLMMAREPRPRR